MHSCELITNLRAKKVLCHRVEVVKNFRCCNHTLCFLQRDWHEQNSSSKSNQLNEAEESAEGHQIGLGGLCWHNFGNNRYQKALSIMRE